MPRRAVVESPLTDEDLAAVTPTVTVTPGVTWPGAVRPVAVIAYVSSGHSGPK